MKHFFAALVAVALITSPGFAKGKPSGAKGHGAKQDKDHGKHDRDNDHRKNDKDRSHGKNDADGRPAGWDQGKKTGWNDCDVPPGQAKKEGCGTTTKHVVVTKKSDPKKVVLKPYPTGPRTTTTTKTTTTTTTKTGEHPFTPVLRKKKEVESTNRELRDIQ